MKISVIMPSYLGEYPGCKGNRLPDFIRAVNSFLAQTHNDKELIIVSDGCQATNITYAKWRFKESQNVKLVPIPKQPLFSGAVRQAGLDAATGDVICYLDSDDFLGRLHLSNIDCMFSSNVSWVYFNSFWHLKELNNQDVQLTCELKEGAINTSNFAHRRGLTARWDSWVGVKENWNFIRQLIESYTDSKRIYGCEYFITHAKIKIQIPTT